MRVPLGRRWQDLAPVVGIIMVGDVRQDVSA